MAKIIDFKTRQVLADLPTDQLHTDKRYAGLVWVDGINAAHFSAIAGEGKIQVLGRSWASGVTNASRALAILLDGAQPDSFSSSTEDTKAGT